MTVLGGCCDELLFHLRAEFPAMPARLLPGALCDRMSGLGQPLLPLPTPNISATLNGGMVICGLFFGVFLHAYNDVPFVGG